MNVSFTPQALRDLRAIGDFISADSPKRARTFVAELREACETLAMDSNRYPVLDRPKGYRRMPVGNYLIFYQVIDARVRIARIVHVARNLRDLALG